MAFSSKLNSDKTKMLYEIKCSYTPDVNKEEMALEKVKKFLYFWYYQYITHTGLYMLESWERGIFSILFT